MDGQCIAQSRQAGVEIPRGNWVWEVDSDAEGGEEGEATGVRCGSCQLTRGKREGLQHFVGRHVQPPQSSQRQDWAQLPL